MLENTNAKAARTSQSLELGKVNHFKINQYLKLRNNNPFYGTMPRMCGILSEDE